MWASKEATAKALSALGVSSGLGSPKRWEVTRWMPTVTQTEAMNDAPLVLGIPTLASGTCHVTYLKRPEYTLISRWWIFERVNKRWALSLTWMDTMLKS
jgi:hypothetical protein